MASRRQQRREREAAAGAALDGQLAAGAFDALAHAAQSETVANGGASTAVVARADFECMAAAADGDPEILRARMPRRIRHHLLNASEDHQAALGIVDAQSFVDFELHARTRQIGHERPQRTREVETVVRVLLGYDRANVGEECPREGLRFLDVAVRGAIGAHERGLKVEREGGEVMPEGVMELAGDAKAFGEAAAVGDEILHRAKLRASPQLAFEELERKEGED